MAHLRARVGGRQRGGAAARRRGPRSIVDAELVGVVVPPPQAALGIGVIVDERLERPRLVTARRLDDHDVGAEVGEQLARRTPRARSRARPPERRPAAREARWADRLARVTAPLRLRGARSRHRRQPRIPPKTSRLCSPRHGRAALDHPVGLREVQRDPVDAHLAHLTVRRPSATDPTRRCPGRRRCGRRAGRPPQAGTPAPTMAAATSKRSRARGPRRHQSVELDFVREATGKGREARRRRPSPRRAPRQRLPVVVVATRDRDPLVVAGRRVDAVRRHPRRLAVVAVGHPGAPQRTAVHRVVEQRGAVERRAGLGARHVDPLALARAVAVDQRREDGDRHEVAAMVVHVGVAPTGPGQAGEPGR